MVIARSVRALVLGLVAALVAGVLASVAVPLALTPAPARAATAYGAPSWWNGDCDTVAWTAKARAAGWTGEAAHRLGGVVLGIPVCGPRNLAGAPNVSWVRPGWGELEWQCVEFAQRFMNQVYGVTPYGANGVDVVSNYTQAKGGGLVRVENGTAGRGPQPGDVMSFSSPSNIYGHVAVVASTTVNAQGNGSVLLATQNDTPDGWRTLTVSGWKVAAFGSLYPYAWLHDPLGRGGSGMSDGAFVLHQGAVYRLAGGAPVYVSSWAPFGGVQPYTTPTDAQWAALRQTPQDGSYLRDPTTQRIYRVAGGAALPLTSCVPASLSGCGSFVEVDPAAIAGAGGSGYWSHLRATVADSTFVRVADGPEQSLVARAAGGSLLRLTDCGDLGGCLGYVEVNATTYAGYLAAHPTPTDGTIVRGEPSGTTRAYTGGACRLTPANTDTSAAVAVNDASLSCLTAVEPAGAPATTLVVGRAVRTALPAHGGSGSYLWTSVTGLPPGLTLTPGGTLTGTPTAAGTYPVRAGLADAGDPADVVPSTVVLTVVAPLSVAGAPTTVDVPVSAAAVTIGGVTGGTGPYRYTVAAGTLPRGVVLDPTGVLTGAAPAPGTWSVTFTVTDASSPRQSVTLTLTLVGVPTGSLTYRPDAPR